MERWLLLVLISCSLIFSQSLYASTCTVKSPDHKVALLELYTSEGCSSCPPADKWLSQLSRQGLDSSTVVPLSLHVDYWNYIGWTDPYSSSEYTNRQREIAYRNRLRTIYTPQMVFQGLDFRSWRRVDFPALVRTVNKEKAVADISLTVTASGPRVFDIKAQAGVRETDLNTGSKLVVAVFENDLQSNVTAGENDGRLLRHDYVVRKLFPSRALSADGRASLTRKLVVPPGWDTTALGVAAFIEHSRKGSLQAVASNLICNSK